MKILMIGLMGLICFQACDKALQDPSKMKLYEGPILKAFDVELILSDSAKVKIKMITPLQLEYENGDQEFPKGIKVIFFDKDAKENTQITANKARFLKAENRYIATSNVVVKNLQKNEQLNTEELNWTPSDKSIFTEQFVTVTTDNEILKGKGLRAKQDFSAYKIKEPTGKFTVKK